MFAVSIDLALSGELLIAFLLIESLFKIRRESMSNVEEIAAELSGNTNFDEDHEAELFDRIAEIEKEEREGELIPGLTKGDYILIVVMFIVFGILPVIWNAVMYF
jgi:hypothetical protein